MKPVPDGQKLSFQCLPPAKLGDSSSPAAQISPHGRWLMLQALKHVFESFLALINEKVENCWG